MNVELLRFLSHFPFFENEKKLFTHLENFLLENYLCRPLLVYSMPKKMTEINIKQCRLILNDEDRVKLYPIGLINEHFIKINDFRQKTFTKVKVDNVFYYYLDLGIKKSQFYFSFFSSSKEISDYELEAIAHFSKSHLKIAEKFDHLYRTQELIHIDDVTGLYNQRKLYKDLTLLVDKFQKEKDPFCVLFIDIDHFKKVNDSHGHLVGTKLLESVAKDIKGLLRESDISYRYGGDEFVVILVNSDAKAGKIVGERILSTVKSKDYNVELKNLNVTHQLSVSIGVAEYPTDAVNAEEMLSIADRMMYEAKESGRGVVFNTQDVFKTSLKKLVNNRKI